MRGITQWKTQQQGRQPRQEQRVTLSTLVDQSKPHHCRHLTACPSSLPPSYPTHPFCFAHTHHSTTYPTTPLIPSPRPPPPPPPPRPNLHVVCSHCGETSLEGNHSQEEAINTTDSVYIVTHQLQPAMFSVARSCFFCTSPPPTPPSPLHPVLSDCPCLRDIHTC